MAAASLLKEKARAVGALQGVMGSAADEPLP